MAQSTGPMLTVTAISFGNQWLGNGKFNLSILVAGGIATVMLAGAEKIPGVAPIAVGVAWVAFITLMFTRLGGKPSPVDNLRKLTGLLSVRVQKTYRLVIRKEKCVSGCSVRL